MHPKLETLLQPLLDLENLDAQSGALEEFYSLNNAGTFGVEDLLGLIDRARSANTIVESDCAASDLLVYAADIAERLGLEANSAVASIAQVVPELNPRAIASALLVLTLIPTEASVMTYTEIVGAYGNNIQIDTLPIYNPACFAADCGPLRNCLLGMLLRANPSVLRGGLLRMLLYLLQDDVLDSTDLDGYTDSFVALVEDTSDICLQSYAAIQSGPSSSRYQYPYVDHRDFLTLLVEIAGWWRKQCLLDIVDGMREHSDPLIRVARALSMLRAGCQIDQTELEWIAEHPRERVLLRSGLEELDLAGLCPKPCRDIATMAEGHMVDWLVFPTELGCEPDEIELLHVEVRVVQWGRRKPRPTEYYFFRFRSASFNYHDMNKWIVGMSGGFQRLSGKKFNYTCDTFSYFNTLRSCTIEQHIAMYLDESEGEELSTTTASG